MFIQPLIEAANDFRAAVAAEEQKRRTSGVLAERGADVIAAEQRLLTQIDRFRSGLRGARPAMKLLVAVAEGAPAEWAASLAGQLAARVGGRIALLHVIDPKLFIGSAPELGFVGHHLYTDLLANGQTLLGAAQAHVPEGIEVERIIRDGDPVRVILDVAKEWKADVIVMGTHAQGRFAHLLLGSTADAVVRSSPIPVLTVASERRALAAVDDAHVGAVNDSQIRVL